MASSIISLILQGEDQASGVIGGVSSALGSIGTVAAGAVVAGAAVAAGAVIAIGAAALDTSSQFAQANNMMQTQLGVTADEAGALGDVVENVWGDNFAGSIEEAGQAVVIVRQQMDRFGEMTEDELTRATENAFRLSDAFDLDIAESTNAANALMENFGLTSDQAFDFITSGMQSGLNASGDFLDTIGEYSNQFSDAGFDAGQFFSILDTGMESGVLGTDKVADAIKEMGIILNEGGDDVKAAFEAAGLSYDQIQASVAAGDEAWADYFDEIVGGLSAIEDPTQRAIAQTAIFGTMAEDLGVSFTDSLSSATTGIEELGGATSTLDAQYNNWPSMWEGIKRQVLLALTPIGDALLNLGNAVMPLVQSALGWFETNLAPALTNVGSLISGFVTTFTTGIQDGQGVFDAFKSALATLVPPETMAQITPVVDAIQSFIDTAIVFVQEHSEEIKGAITAIGVVLAGAGIATAIMGIVGAISALINPVTLIIGGVALLGAAWAGNWGGIQDKTKAVIDFIQPIIQTALTNIQTWWAENGDQIITNVTNAWNTIQTAIRTVITFISTAVQTALTGIQTWWSEHGTSVMTIASAAYEAIKTGIETAITTVQTIIDTVLTAIKTFWDEHGTAISESASLAWEAIQTVVSTVTEAIGIVIDAFAAAVEGDWTAFGETLREAWDTLWEGINTALDTASEAIETTVSSLVDSIIAFFTDTDWGQVGSDIISGIANGISSATQFIIDAATAAAQAALDAALGFLGGGGGGNEGGSTGQPAIPGNATGTNFWQGGYTIVGEEGPELVDLPRGSRIFPANQTAQMLSPTSGQPVSNNQTTIIFQPGSVVINDTSAMEMFLSFLEGNIQTRALGNI